LSDRRFECVTVYVQTDLREATSAIRTIFAIIFDTYADRRSYHRRHMPL